MTDRADCETMEEWISESLDLPLSEERRSALGAHLADCLSCGRFLADLEDMTLELGPPAPELQRLWSRLRPRAPKKSSRVLWLKVAAIALFGAASYVAGRLSAPEGQPLTARNAAQAAHTGRDRALGDISARMAVAALVPGEGDPGSILVEETSRLAEPELIPSHD